jgi:2-oxoglutarate ferredoxin oxidoreductase subunit alpha
LSQDKIVNDVTIQAATVNGSGSQSANLILTRTIFRMGVPVGPKNLFPSNIAGLPTWFTVRVNKDGYVARKRELNILVAMNLVTFHEDIPHVEKGGVIIYNSAFTVPENLKRDDVTWYPVPFDDLAKEKIPQPKLRKLLTNMIYVGVLAELLELDQQHLEDAISAQFAGKEKAIAPNVEAVAVGRSYFQENFKKEDPFYIEAIPGGTDGYVMMEGNQSGALGAVMAGCTVMGWYPITPSSSFCENMIAYANKFRFNEDGTTNFAHQQMEDELASAGMVLGAGWAGARSLTATSGAGISLMNEFIGLGYFAEIPGVFVDVQRMGPSTGLPTRTCQADIVSTYNASHGDCRHVMLIPSSVEEIYEMMFDAFDMTEKLQTPVFVMSDLDLGMNQWMTKELPTPKGKVFARGKVLSKEELEAQGGKFSRYLDKDGDGIGYRTLPGTDHPGAAYFTRGTGHDEHANYSEKPEHWVANMDRLYKKFETAREMLPKPVIDKVDGSKVGIIAYGSTDQCVRELRDILESENNMKTDYLRVKALPLCKSVRAFIEEHDVTYVIEQNPGAQLLDILHNDFPDLSDKMKSGLQYDGLPADARTFQSQIVN